MAKNRRRNKRTTELIDTISTKKFFIMVGVLSIIIAMCLVIINYRTDEEKRLLARQKEELDKQMEIIFTETIDEIAQAKEDMKPDTIIKLSAVGDILCGDEMTEDAYNSQTNEYDFSAMFSKITGLIQKADISIGTMETNFTNSAYSGYGRCNSPKEFAKAVKESGINLVSISHNHSLDYGLKGLKDTKKHLTRSGI